MVVEIDNLTRDVSKWIQNETTLKIPNGLVIMISRELAIKSQGEEVSKELFEKMPN